MEDKKSSLDYALEYMRLGWHVMPTRPGAKQPASWLVPNGVHGATCDPETARRWWGSNPHCGIGIALLPSKLVAVDIDPRNGGLDTMADLEAQHGPLVSDVLAFTGGGGEHRVFSATLVANLPGTLGPGVDLKADGYIVVEPSMHPSGKRYGWELSSDPLNGAVPSALPGWIRDLGKPVAASVASAGPEFVTPEQQAELASALQALSADDYHRWVQVGMALHGTHDHAWAYQAWDAWSQASSKYDPLAMGKKWASFHTARAGTTVSYRSIFTWAQEAGWKQPQPPAAPLPRHLTNEALAALVSKPLPPVMERLPDCSGVVPFPVESLNNLAAWFDRSGDSTHPVASQAGVLAVVMAAAARRYVSPQGDPASGYIGVLAPSLPSVRYVGAGIEKVLIDAGCAHHLRTGRMTSPQHVYSTLYREPASIYMPDDFGGQVRFARRQPSGQTEQTLTLLCGRIYAGAMLVLDNWQEVGFTKQPEGENGQPIIHAPSLSMFAPLASESLQQVFKAGEFARGMVDSLLLAPALDDGRWSYSVARVRAPVPDATIERVRQLRGMLDQDTAPHANLGALAVVAPTLRVVKFAGPVAEIEDNWIRLFAGQRREVVQLAAGARRALRRLCTAMGAWANPTDPVATRDIVSWCAQFIKVCLDATIEQTNLRLADEDEKPDTYQRVLEVVQNYGRAGVSQRDLVNFCRAFRALKQEARRELVDSMLDDELVAELPTLSGKGKVLVAASFLKASKHDTPGYPGVDV